MGRSFPAALVVFIVFRLLEEKVRGQLLVFVAGEVSLNSQITLETEAAELCLVSTNTDSARYHLPFRLLLFPLP